MHIEYRYKVLFCQNAFRNLALVIKSNEDIAIDFLGTRVLLLCRGYSSTHFHNIMKYLFIISLVRSQNGNFFFSLFLWPSNWFWISLPEVLVTQVAYLEKFKSVFLVYINDLKLMCNQILIDLYSSFLKLPLESTSDIVKSSFFK